MPEGFETMGRGRQKAKQAKVARELKYDSGSIDLGALEAELHSNHEPANKQTEDNPDGDYSAWIEDEDENADTEED
ncbi:MAG: hypothetical protein RLZZ330_1099 [Actinomycetota bacterium]